MPAPRVTVAGESALWVDPAEVPAGADVAGPNWPWCSARLTFFDGARQKYNCISAALAA